MARERKGWDCQTQGSIWRDRRGGQALPILKLGSPLLLCLKILSSGALLNPTTFQNAFCSPVTTCFTCKPKSSCPFCAEGSPPLRMQGEEAAHAGFVQLCQDSASFLLTQLACSPSPPDTACLLSTTNPFPLSLQQQGMGQARFKSWALLRLS